MILLRTHQNDERLEDRQYQELLKMWVNGISTYCQSRSILVQFWKISWHYLIK